MSLDRRRLIQVGASAALTACSPSRPPAPMADFTVHIAETTVALAPGIEARTTA